MGEDWVAFLNSLPGAGAAFAELVGDIGLLGSALARIGITKLDAVSRITDARTSAQVRLIDAETEAKIEGVKEGALTLQHRAKLMRIRKEQQEQANREAITLLALNNIKDDPPQGESSAPPTPDWFNIFGSYAEKATSEDFRQHWAYILEHEIRKPGSFSFGALHLASLLDKNLAQKIQSIASYVVLDTAVAEVTELNSGSLFGDLLDLANIGFLNLSKTGIFLPFDRDYAYLEIGNRLARIRFADNTIEPFKKFWEDGRIKISLTVRHLTMAGREILGVIPHKQDPALLEKMISEMPKHLLTGEIVAS